MNKVVYGPPEKAHEYIVSQTHDNTQHVVLISSTKKIRDGWSTRPNTEVFTPQHADLLTILQHQTSGGWLIIEQAQNFKPCSLQQVIEMGKSLRLQIMYTHKIIVEQMSTQYIQSNFHHIILTKSKFINTAVNLFGLSMPPSLTFEDTQVLYFSIQGVFDKLETITSTPSSMINTNVVEQDSSLTQSSVMNKSFNRVGQDAPPLTQYGMNRVGQDSSLTRNGQNNPLTRHGQDTSSTIQSDFVSTQHGSKSSTTTAKYIDSVITPNETHFHILSNGKKDHNDSIIEVLKVQSTIFLDHIDEKYKDRIKIKLLPNGNLFYIVITHKPEYGDIVLLWTRRVLLSLPKHMVLKSWIDISGIDVNIPNL